MLFNFIILNSFLFSLISFSQGINEWTNSGFKNIKINPLDIESYSEHVKYTHLLSFNLLLLQESSWSYAHIKNHWIMAAKVFSQCGIKLHSINLITASLLDKVTSFEDDRSFPCQSNFCSSHLARMIPKEKKMIGIYFQSEKRGKLAWSGSEAQFGRNSPFYNTFWISYGINYHNYPIGLVEAHELGHNLLNNPLHLEDGSLNFMAGKKENMSYDITDSQCEMMKKNSKKISQ